MLHTAKNTTDKVLADEMGRIIPHVFSFDDETNEVVGYIPTQNGSIAVSNGSPKIIKYVLEGAKLVDKE